MESFKWGMGCMFCVLWESSQLLLGETLETLGLVKPPRIEWTLRIIEEVNKLTWTDHGKHFFIQCNPQPEFLDFWFFLAVSFQTHVGSLIPSRFWRGLCGMMIDDHHTGYWIIHSFGSTSLAPHAWFSHSVLDCPSYRYFLWFLWFHFANSSHIFGSSWERLLGHVCHTTDKQADAAPNVWLFNT